MKKQRKKRPEYEKLVKIVKLIQSLNLDKLEKELDFGIPKNEWKINQKKIRKFLEEDVENFYGFLENYTYEGNLDIEVKKRYEENILMENYLKFMKISEDLIFIDYDKLDYELDIDNNPNAVNDDKMEEFYVELSGSYHTLKTLYEKYFEDEEKNV
uniref:Uncharacterized protein n=1 Tax=Promethearchaeum syntrophicum TaxID=2594042 RepID=A0A5B9DF63_9ARCH|nr:hypothetical protein [Candidatus Prometheoarchaeum syntrophicum]QEE17774.1 hypothetical protein DSAG12_03612 [Candidatus Prometheoarchaeum syntrophicum]